jgi:hypothetical protein
MAYGILLRLVIAYGILLWLIMGNDAFPGIEEAASSE